MTTRRCQEKKNSAASAPRWKATMTPNVNQLMPSPMVAARPMRISSRADTTTALGYAAVSEISGIAMVEFTVVVSGEGAAVTVAIFTKDPWRVAAGPPYSNCKGGRTLIERPVPLKHNQFE